jgi:preprotein translocase subunit SecD
MKFRLGLIAAVVVIAVFVNIPLQFRSKVRWPLADGFLTQSWPVPLGLDLQGGVHLSYQAETGKLTAEEQKVAVESVRSNIERRVNLFGATEPIIQTAKVGDQWRLIVELPGVSDVNKAISIIGATAKLDFREGYQATPGAQTQFIPTDLTGGDLRLAQVNFGASGNKTSGQPTVSLQFTPEGAKKFAKITERSVGKPLAVYLDNNLITAPTVQSIISDGRAIISGNFSLAEAKNLVIQLNAGALPIPIKIIEQRTVGATLGNDSIKKSLVAGIIGFLTVVWFMLGNYGKKGAVASVALAIYVLIFLTIVRLMPITLTMAGIAGLVLSVGMAVDANILIFERIKEEISWGRPKNAALELGFHRAWGSIRDSNVSSIITALILFGFGSGSVRGFALTMIVGIVISLFTAIVVTQTLLRAGQKKI